MNVNARRSFVQTQRLCYKCLGGKHLASSCRQPARCKICNKGRHHTLLHPQNSSVDCEQWTVPVKNKDEPSDGNVVSQGESIVNCFSNVPSQVLLATALVKVEARTGALITLRSLLDQGSQALFITDASVQLLGLKRFASKGLISGLGCDQTGSLKAKSVVYFKIQSFHNPEFAIKVKAHVLNKITAFLPERQGVVQSFYELSERELADPTFNVPNKIDLLLGAEVYGQILEDGIIKGPPGFPIAQKTKLGWILSSQIYSNCRDNLNQDKVVSMHTHYDENELLRRFWELESEIPQRHFTPEESRCEELYTATTKREPLGRYIVKLPFREEDPACKYGNSRAITIKRFNYLERKLLKTPWLKVEYVRVIQEYLDLGHMELVPEAERGKLDAVYLPHHAVVREDETTSKVRVVFDASCSGTNGVSLNSNLMVGPTIQPDLRSIILRWRLHPVCLTADIIKMYRQIRIFKEDSDFQRIVWRNPDNPQSELQDFRLRTVTFGTSSAPYLAVRTLQQLAHDEGKDYPSASVRVLEDFYMDDLITGCQTVEEEKKIYEEMNELLGKGGFQMQKWSSNKEELLGEIRKGKEEGEGSLKIKIDEVIKILGLTWNCQSDVFEYSVQLQPLTYPITKRQVISDTARLFDPLGWIAPTIIIAKIFIQKLWLSGIKWDDEFPPQLLDEWVSYRKDLELLTGFRIPRWINTTQDDKVVELHGFCDASNDAYAAVVYLRVIDVSGRIHVNLVTAKTRVAPVKQVSIPRLELCGAVMLAKMLHEVSLTLKIPKPNLYAWTDSSVVLAWLSSHPSRWKTFIANRVSEILNVLDNDQWNHVQSPNNPADCASRGAKPLQYPRDEMWTRDPSWIWEDKLKYSTRKIIDTILEEKAKGVCHVAVEDNFSLWDRFSSLSKLVRVVALCRRFLKLRQASRIKHTKWISSTEIFDALNVCIRQCQAKHFEEDLDSLDKMGRVNKGSRLTSLNPFLDNVNLLRVGGRLQLSELSGYMKHPVLIPRKSSLTQLLIADAHGRTLHGGPQVMVNYLRTKYWIIDVKNLARYYVRNCVTCVRHAARTTHQLMGQLPTSRVTPCRPFLRTGVDYAGPISIRTSKGRGHRFYKGYICLFICMVTRAVHLEAVTDLTAQGYLAAFKRFVARRGHCAELWSDNATNFVGAAAKKLKSLFLEEQSNIVVEVAEALALNGTSWHFIPPRAPNFGGLWEAGIRSTKHHLGRIVGNATLTFEELSTVLAQIEACLNSRPISQVCDNPDEPMPLTPGHFLIGEPLILVPDCNYEQTNISSLRRWQLTQKMIQQFWRRWSAEYLTHFHHRYKWAHNNPEPNIGDVVLVKEDDLPPARWLHGIITEKHTGLDNVTRVVSLKCKGNSIIKRPTSKLIVLEVK